MPAASQTAAAIPSGTGHDIMAAAEAALGKVCRVVRHGFDPLMARKTIMTYRDLLSRYL